MKPLVSCIIPVMNGERFIGEAIASILSQTHQPVEVIVVDDGSTDDTEGTVKRSSPLAQYVHQTNAGPARARNNGLGYAKGEYIAFLDADDRWLPHKLARQFDEFAAHPELDCVISRVRMFWEGLEKEEAAYRHDNREETAGFANSTMLVKRTLFDRLGPFDESLPHSATVEWFRQFEDAGVNSTTLQEVLVERRMHEHNFGRQKRAMSHDEFLHLVKRNMDAKRKKPPTA